MALPGNRRSIHGRHECYGWPLSNTTLLRLLLASTLFNLFHIFFVRSGPVLRDEELRNLKVISEGVRDGLSHFGLVLTFTQKQLDAATAAVDGWSRNPPCLNQKATSGKPLLMFYTDAGPGQLPELDAALRNGLNIKPEVRACFSAVTYEYGNLSADVNIYDKRRLDHTWSRGPNSDFYHLVFITLQQTRYADLEHMLHIEPDCHPVRPGWLDHIMVHAQLLGEYWIQGSAYQGKCQPTAGGTWAKRSDGFGCTGIGKGNVPHINGNALYGVGKGALREFYEEVVEGEFKDWPFDLAPFHHMREVWPEWKWRQHLHLFHHVSWIQNYGNYPVRLDSLPASVQLVHYNSPAFPEEFPEDQIEEAELDRVERWKACERCKEAEAKGQS